MLNVENKKCNPFKPQKLKKGGNFDHGSKKYRARLVFFCNLLSRFALILTKI